MILIYQLATFVGILIVKINLLIWHLANTLNLLNVFVMLVMRKSYAV